MYYGYIIDKKGDIIDEVTMVEMPEGRSYTGQKQVEIFCHGGQFVLRRILAEIFSHNVRPAEPGEFTRRAFLAGRIDLARAEAVADLVASKTEYAYSAAKMNLLGQLSEHIDGIRKNAIELLAEVEASIDFPEEELDRAEKRRLLRSIETMILNIKELADSYRAGQIIKDGYRIAIAGRPNAGKSSLFNLFLSQNRAIVTPTPGTTRDYLTEWIDLDGIAVSFTDTAGLRSGAGITERTGQQSAIRVIKESNLIIWIVDIARPGWRKELFEDLKQFRGENDILITLNKIDKVKDLDKKQISMIPGLSESMPIILLSCRTKAGFKSLRKKLADRINRNLPDLTDRLVVTSERHKKKLEKCLKSMRRVRRGLIDSVSPELIAFDLRQGINEIDEITGRVYNEEILDRIFSRFCIGK